MIFLRRRASSGTCWKPLLRRREPQRGKNPRMATLRQILKLSLLEAQEKQRQDERKAKEEAKKARRAQL